MCFLVSPVEVSLLACNERTLQLYACVLADSHKFNRDSFINNAPLNAVTRIYTDSGLAESEARGFESAGARIHIVEFPGA